MKINIKYDEHFALVVSEEARKAKHISKKLVFCAILVSKSKTLSIESISMNNLYFEKSRSVS